MPRVKSIIYVDFTTWDDIEDPVRSLINFYMKNASCFFSGDTTNNVLSSMSGNIRANLHSIMSVENDLSDFATPTGLEMDIVYSDSTFPSTAHNWLPNCITNIVTRNSLVKLCKMTSSTVETFSGGIDPIDSLSVTLTPKIGDTVITDTRYIPKNIKSGIVRTGVDTSHQDFESDYQLRTSSFYIDDGEGNIEQDVFYKIGICPLDNKYPYSNFSGTPTDGLSLEDIQSLLKNDNLSLKIDNTYIQSYYYRLLNGNMAIENSSTFGNGGYGFAKSFIIPIIDEDIYIVGLAYAELYKQNGDLFTADVTNTDIEIYCRPSENEDPELVRLSGNGLQLTLTDQHLDSGFIYTEYEKDDGDDITKPLTFRATSDNSSVTLKQEGSPSGSFEYSLDGGSTWNSYNIDTAISLNEGDEVCFKSATDRSVNQTYEDYVYFEMTGFIEAWHNVGSMLYASNYNSHIDISTMTYAFYCLFTECTSLVKAPLLPATTLSDSCYCAMFSGCTSLTSGPVLPATTLANSCYNSMFYGCTSLTSGPALPATTLAEYCYCGMFEGCTSLTSGPDLPATTLAYYCYGYMFSGCTSLTSGPDLPATTLAYYCYYGMFEGCTSLTSGPALPATTLAEYCYGNMFYGCTSLTSASSLPAITLAEFCYGDMFADCTSLTKAPLLPATTLTISCYYEMFYGCTSLTSEPDLPATTLAESCYLRMFSGCTSLTSAPNLPATTLAEYCYCEMFDGCTSLTSAPNLPATTLTISCYSEMFYGCTSLITAPSLPATILTYYCYYSMFSGCSNLSYVECYATSFEESSCYEWLMNVSATGDFYADPNASWKSGSSGIPSGWTRHNITIS